MPARPAIARPPSKIPTTIESIPQASPLREVLRVSKGEAWARRLEAGMENRQLLSPTNSSKLAKSLRAWPHGLRATLKGWKMSDDPNKKQSA